MKRREARMSDLDKRLRFSRRVMRTGPRRDATMAACGAMAAVVTEMAERGPTKGAPAAFRWPRPEERA